MIIIGTSTLFGRILTIYRVPGLMVETLTSISTNPTVIMLILLGIFIVLGMFMETISTIIIVTPLLLPLTNALGIDPLVFGVFFVATNTVAFTTPPLGVNLFVAAKLSNLSVERVFVNVFPYIMIEIIVIVLMVFFPDIVLFLPELLGY
jgi:C4-dicarboxylate transporter DctM subunit